MSVKITLGENLTTAVRLENHDALVKTAHNDPRQDMQPGELLAGALGACMLTMIGYAAQKRGENVTGTQLKIEPVFGAKPRRVVEVKMSFAFPAALSDVQKKFYVQAAQTCPVHNSLREDIVYKVEVR